ncbi:class I SAM-dependent methyltransferase [Solicola gregarius]|uniref:Class I SAM-dependent methyltransferase n=1 Tax=Solicola gregarius TaxID=2908642 RepID=A0AA46YKB6_9ACTN|nr:class I SAM-dependent methyltransferase [Solicola gregarius]UYM05580.1 class I SAM-dependent methyltransferase [Solicola gregarius]
MSIDPSRADWSDELEMLERDGELSRPWVEQAARWLLVLHPQPPVRRFVDVGAGPGHAACQFADLLPDAMITALDPTRAFLDRARERATQLGLSSRFATYEGALDTDVHAVAPADLIWASHVLHHMPNPVDALRRLRGALVPDGVLAVAEGGLPMRVLPGGYGVARPSFVDRLEATVGDYFLHRWSLTDSATGGTKDWPMMLAEAGLEPIASKTFILEHQAPVHARVREHIVDRFTRVRELVSDRLTSEEAAALDRLLDSSDPAGLVRRPDLFLLAAYTVHAARRPA